jgi:hypothetical protein
MTVAEPHHASDTSPSITVPARRTIAYHHKKKALMRTMEQCYNGRQDSAMMGDYSFFLQRENKNIPKRKT